MTGGVTGHVILVRWIINIMVHIIGLFMVLLLPSSLVLFKYAAVNMHPFQNNFLKAHLKSGVEL